MVTKQKGYIVYFATMDDYVLYVGSGVVGRENHVTSGKSHVIELNRLKFENKKVDVAIVKTFDNQDDSLQYEVQMINKYDPIFNKQHRMYTCDTSALEDQCNSSIDWLVKVKDQVLTGSLIQLAKDYDKRDEEDILEIMREFNLMEDQWAYEDIAKALFYMKAQRVQYKNDKNSLHL